MQKTPLLPFTRIELEVKSISRSDKSECDSKPEFFHVILVKIGRGYQKVAGIS